MKLTAPTTKENVVQYLKDLIDAVEREEVRLKSMMVTPLAAVDPTMNQRGEIVERETFSMGVDISLEFGSVNVTDRLWNRFYK
jgi:hypothetical protein